MVGTSDEEWGGAWQKIVRGLEREEASPTHSEHFRAMKKFYRNKLYGSTHKLKVASTVGFTQNKDTVRF